MFEPEQTAWETPQNNRASTGAFLENTEMHTDLLHPLTALNQHKDNRLPSIHGSISCRCSSLSSLPGGLGNLSSLTTLNLAGCEGLGWIPDSLSGLCCLSQLDLVNCSSLSVLPEGLTAMTQLTQISLDSCSRIASLPTAFSELTNLRGLSLAGCEMLTSLPQVGGWASPQAAMSIPAKLPKRPIILNTPGPQT